MKRKLLMMLVILSLLPFSLAHGEVMQTTRYLENYGYTLDVQMEARARELVSPITITCAGLKICLQEIIYDGCWLYAGAAVEPVDPSNVLVIPAGLDMNDPVQGIWREEYREDERTFREAAMADGKRLLCLYAYPAVFEHSYYLDAYQMEGNLSFLFSGGSYISKEDKLIIEWTIQVYEVDLNTGKLTLLHEERTPMDIAPLQPLEIKRYHAVEDEPAPLQEVELLQSALAFYLNPIWEHTADSSRYIVRLVQADGQAPSLGLPPGGDSFTLESLPEKITIEVIDTATEKANEIVLVSDEMWSSK